MNIIIGVAIVIVVTLVYIIYKCLDVLTQDALEYEQKLINKRKNDKLKKGGKNEM